MKTAKQVVEMMDQMIKDIDRREGLSDEELMYDDGVIAGLEHAIILIEDYLDTGE